MAADIAQQFLRVLEEIRESAARHRRVRHRRVKDYSHRKARVLERLQIQPRVFALDICAYAVTSNHYHLVL